LEPLGYGPAELVAIALAIRIILSVTFVRFGSDPPPAPRSNPTPDSDTTRG